jgi:hypothetical protein
VTGAISGIVVLDLDGEEGEASLNSLGHLPVTPKVRTGRGHHLYFKHPGTFVGNPVNTMPGLDVRGDGGYVVAPPSIHPDGSVYEWALHPSEVPFAELPNRLIELLKTSKADEELSHLVLDGKDPKLRGVCNVPRAYRNEIEQLFGRLAQSREGQRNDTLNKTAFALGQMMASGVVDAEWAATELQTIAEQLGLPPDEALATITSGLNAGTLNPRENPKPFFQILESSPELMDRPLRLINGKAYGATWLPIAPHGDLSGKASRTELVIFEADGEFFSAADIPGSRPIEDLPIRVDLPFVPRPDKLLSPRGFKSLMERENPAILFSQVTEAVDRFVSFENSLADQRAMCELVACWIIGTYFLDAFDAVGYLWPTGERNSGKTQLLNTVCSIAYLGKTTTSGSSFAAIRDDAHYGATLAFDDCEDLRSMEPSKRELLLAGNSRGTVISRKEPVSDSEWRTTYVNNFAPRLFSSIGLPDPVLGSRTISIPLITSLDRSKTRRSPLRLTDWSHDRQRLVDTLWKMAVCYLPRVRECDQEASDLSSLEARGHDIWRMSLAIAYWLQQDHGVEGVWDRLQHISASYRSLQAENEEHDLLTLVVLAVYELAAEAGADIVVATRAIAQRVNQIATGDGDGWDIGPDEVQRVGRMMKRLGFEKSASHGRSRSWRLSRRKIEDMAKGRSIALGLQLKAA